MNPLRDAYLLPGVNDQKRDIAEYVGEILRVLGDEILAAQQSGQTQLDTNIPHTFMVTNMSVQRARESIWADVIAKLRERHYRVAISHGRDFCRLRIKWITEEEEYAIDRQRAILREHYAEF